MSVSVQDQFLIDKYKALPFVKQVVLVYEGKRKSSSEAHKYVDSPQTGNFSDLGKSIDYGSATMNISTVKGEALHQQGFKGAEMDIAVIDAGYASPIMCGLVACLWQAYPTLTNQHLMEIIRKSADRANHPELPFGYGVADMSKAIELANIRSGSK